MPYISTSEEKVTSESLLKLYIYQILSAINYLHTNGICHGDISRRNIIIQDTNAYLIDFGQMRFSNNYRSDLYGFSEAFHKIIDPIYREKLYPESTYMKGIRSLEISDELKEVLLAATNGISAASILQMDYFSSFVYRIPDVIQYTHIDIAIPLTKTGIALIDPVKDLIQFLGDELFNDTAIYALKLMKKANSNDPSLFHNESSKYMKVAMYLTIYLKYSYINRRVNTYLILQHLNLNLQDIETFMKACKYNIIVR